MTLKNYQNLEIQFTKIDTDYLALLQGPDGRRMQIRFANPFSEYQLKYYISEMTRGPEPIRRSVSSDPEVTAKELGGILFQTIFSGQTRQQLDQAIDQLKPSDGLRIRLDLDAAPELASLPWEYLFYSDRNLFLALSPDTCLVRYVRVLEPIPSLQVEPPLRILAMACSPKDLPSLNVVLERQQLDACLGRLVKANLVQIDWLGENSLGAIENALRCHDYHIFHFVGHGAFDLQREQPMGVLLLEDDQHNAVEVTGEKLGWILRRSVRLAVINACEGARNDVGDASTGVASNLLLQGVPAVVAMQFSISDVIAAHFAQNFYGGLAIGLPVDAAMNSARRSVLAHPTGSTEWATPVLFMRSPDGQIFDVATLKPMDAEAAQIHRDTIETAFKNLDIDWSQIAKWVGAQTDTFIAWAGLRLPNLPASNPPPTSIDALYQEALTNMKEERWSNANHLFRQINRLSPGYADIAAQWQHSLQQERLALLYGRLTEDYAQERWNKVLTTGEEIFRISPEYKEIQRYYAEAYRHCNASHPQVQVRLDPPPNTLPPSRAIKPPTLPGVGASMQKPSILPEGNNLQKQRKPLSLPS